MTRRERHEELISYAIDGAVTQVERAYEMSDGKGAININVLWEMGGAQPILHGVLERTRGKVAGVTCGAGMPYKLSEIAASYGVSYLPIVSSGRAFRALWKRAYSKFADCCRAWSTRIRGSPAGTMASAMPKTRRSRRIPLPRVAELRTMMRDAACPTRADRHGGRRVAAGRVGRLDRQSRAWRHHVPVRHPAAADPGKPDPARMEGAADDAGGGRRPAPQVLADRLLQLGGAQPLSSATWKPERAPDRLHQGAGRRHMFELDVGIGTKKNYWVTKGDLQHAREWYGAGYTRR
jgi:nitronate monooxygenase